MATLAELQNAQQAAHAAWAACPEKSRADKADKSRLKSLMAEATKAVAAAKRAAEPAAPVVDQAALAAAFLARQAQNEADAALTRRVYAAWRQYQTATDWPRCGQGWPANSSERAAEALLRQHSTMLAESGWDE